MHRALQKVLLPLGLFVCAAPLWAAQTADEGLTKSVPCAACHRLRKTHAYNLFRYGPSVLMPSSSNGRFIRSNSVYDWSERINCVKFNNQIITANS